MTPTGTESLAPERGVAAPTSRTNVKRKEHTMKRTLKLIAAVLAATAVGVVAYDRNQADDDAPWFGPAVLQTASIDRTGGYRVEAAPKTVVDLGRKRNGCTPVDALPAQTVCDLAVAFPDVGLDGRVTFVSSTHVPRASRGLTIDLGK